jgi:hypothetical protein
MTSGAPSRDAEATSGHVEQSGGTDRAGQPTVVVVAPGVTMPGGGTEKTP